MSAAALQTTNRFQPFSFLVRSLLPIVFSLALFLSAALLFSVQPMVAKIILPSLGGSPSVWTTCMLFFQLVLLAGYAYAHGITSWLRFRWQLLLHLAILLSP